MSKNRLPLVVLGLVGLAAALAAQAPPAPTPAMTEKSFGSGPLDRLAFRQIGPGAPSGRIDDFAVLESDPSTFYVAAATGAIHKTTNGGVTFTQLAGPTSTIFRFFTSTVWSSRTPEAAMGITETWVMA